MSSIDLLTVEINLLSDLGSLEGLQFITSYLDHNKFPLQNYVTLFVSTSQTHLRSVVRRDFFVTYQRLWNSSRQN